jgi:hypothetical protein
MKTVSVRFGKFSTRVCFSFWRLGMLRSFVFFVVAMFCATAAQAGFLGSVLTFNGVADQINTINNPVGRSTFVTVTTNTGTYTIAYGWIGSTQVTNDIATSDPFDPETPVVGTPSGNEVPFGGNRYAAAVFSGVVNNNPGSDPADQETFLTAVDPTWGTGLSIPELLGQFSGAGQQLDSVTNAVAAVLTGSTSGGVNDLKEAWALGAATSVTDVELDDFFDNANFSLEFALTTDGGFFQSALDRTNLIQRAGLNVIESTLAGGIGAGTTFRPVPVGTLFAPSVDFADVAVDNTLVGTITGQRGFSFTVNSSSIRLNAVPEPTSILVFASLGVVGLASRRRIAAKL